MGSSISIENDTNKRANVKVYTMGRSFVVGHMNLQPGEKATRKVHKVWYDLVYDFGQMNEDGSRAEVHLETDGQYFAKPKQIKLSEILERALHVQGGVDEEEGDSDDTHSIKSSSSLRHPPTKDQGTPLPEHALTAQFPCAPVEVYNLAFKNKDFREWQRKKSADDQFDFDEQDWKKNEQGKERRELIFTMKLHGSVGPSSTKCEVTEEVEHLDEEEYIALLGTTRTPDVPYGKSFHTETRTVFTWSKKGGTEMSVSIGTIWDKSSMLKSVIEKQSNAGQIAANKKLVADLKRWIAEHPDDFESHEGEDPEVEGAETKETERSKASTTGATATEKDGLQKDDSLTAVLPAQFDLHHPLVVYILIFTNLFTFYLWLRA